MYIYICVHVNVFIWVYVNYVWKVTEEARRGSWISWRILGIKLMFCEKIVSILFLTIEDSPYPPFHYTLGNPST